MELVSAHLEECSECGDQWAEMAGRASRVSALMGQLTETEPMVRARRLRAPCPIPLAVGRGGGGPGGRPGSWDSGNAEAWNAGGDGAAQPAPVVQSAVTRPEPPAPVVSLASARPPASFSLAATGSR